MTSVYLMSQQICTSSRSWVHILAFFLVSALWFRTVVRKELVTVWFTFLTSRRNHKGISLLFQYKVLSLLTGVEFLWFLFNLWMPWVFLIKTGVPLRDADLLEETLLFLTFMLLWDCWRNKRTQEKSFLMLWQENTKNSMVCHSKY